MSEGNELWICPVCGRRFARANQSHSCGIFSEEDFLRNISSDSIALYKQFKNEVNKTGPCILAPAKTRIGFQVRMIFAAIYRSKAPGLRGHLILAGERPSRKFHKIEVISPRNVIHYFTIRSVDFFDEELRELLAESYKVGAQEHLRKR